MAVQTARRLVTLLACLLTLATACTAPRRVAEPVTITFACKEYQLDWFQELAEGFQGTHPDIQVRILSADEITGNAPNVRSTDDVLRIARAADAFVESASLLDWVPPQEVILDLTDLAGQDKALNRDDFYPGVLAPFQRGSKLWGLPQEAVLLVVYYNPAMFDAAGVAYPRIGWSWDDLLEAASRLTVREGDTVRQYGYMDPWPGYSLLALAHQTAGPLLEYDYDVPAARLDTPGVAEALQWYADLALRHGVMPNLAAMDDAARQRFTDEQSPAMWIGFSYELASHRARCGAAVAPFPQAGDPATVLRVQGCFVSAGTAHPDAAWRWIEFLTREPPDPRLNGIPVRKSAAEKGRYWEKLGAQEAAAYQHTLQHAVTYPDVVWAALRQALYAVLQNEPLPAALATAQARVGQKLAERQAQGGPTPAGVVVATALPTAMPGSTRIRFSIPAYLADSHRPVYRALAERFAREHPAIYVEVDTSGGQSLQERADEADCFVHPLSGLQVDQLRAVLNLDPLLAEDGQLAPDAFYPTFIGQAQAQGGLWALPLEADARFLYYNRELFDEAGLPYPAADWTSQHWVAQAIALTDTSLPQAVYGFFPRDGAYADLPHSVERLGGVLFDAEGWPAFDAPGVIAAVTLYADLVHKACPPMAAERGEAHWPAHPMLWGGRPGPVSDGRVAMWADMHGNQRVAPALPFPVGVAPLPGGNALLDQDLCYGLFVSAKTPHPKACWEWIAFLSGQEEAVLLLPTRQDVARSSRWRERAGAETAQAWLALLERVPSRTAFWPQTPTSYALYWFEEAFSEVLAGEPAATALAEAQGKAAAFGDCLDAGDGSEEAWRRCIQETDPEAIVP